MTEDDSSTDDARARKAITGALQGSGFPFQTAVANVIADTRSAWHVHASEYAWQTPRGETHFLDLVATNGRMYLAIECKKTRKDIFTFLRPIGAQTTGLVTEFRCLRAHPDSEAPHRVGITCETWELYPRSIRSEFCVVSTSESGDQRLLERDASLLIQGTDAFAHRLTRTFHVPPPDALIVPVIVTNAPVYTARYQPTTVSLKSGVFSKLPEEVQRTECVRFEKSFPSDSINDLGDRTVFVVHAPDFGQFLTHVDPAPGESARHKHGVRVYQRPG
jgi:hypothetical protein